MAHSEQSVAEKAWQRRRGSVAMKVWQWKVEGARWSHCTHNQEERKLLPVDVLISM